MTSERTVSADRSVGTPTELQTAATALTWIEAGRDLAVGLLCEVDGSAPLGPGRMLFVTADGEIEGTITGGCVESAVAQEAIAALATDRAPRLRRYGVSDELAGSAGLLCGGTVQIMIDPVLKADPIAHYLAAIADHRAAALATFVDEPYVGVRVAVAAGRPAVVAAGAKLPELLLSNLEADLKADLDRGRSQLRHYGLKGRRLGADVAVQITTHAPPPRMLLVGAIDFSAALAMLATTVGYQVTICDPRTAFLSSTRFTAVASTDARWPDAAIAALGPQSRDAVVVFTHDDKLDTPALTAALSSQAGYVGALGSRRTTKHRLERLRAAGMTAEQLQRLHSPCGLNIGAATPEETAVSILAEIIASYAGRSGGALRDGSGAIRPHPGEGL